MKVSRRQFCCSSLALTRFGTWPDDTFTPFSQAVGGRGCVFLEGKMAHSWGDLARPGEVASASKPVFSLLLMMAIQEGLIQSADEPVAWFEDGLRRINGGKDEAMTWRHLASMTSGYGLTEKPGEAWAYNDFAIALYFDTLMRVFKAESDPDRVLQMRIAKPLGFEDRCTFFPFPNQDRFGRLAVSPRDFAKIGRLFFQEGVWEGKPLIKPKLMKMLWSSQVPASIPQSGGRAANMLPDQRSIGGGKQITRVGPGYYSFNLWTNGRDMAGRRLWADLPPEAYAFSGHGGIHAMWVIPSWKLVASWNDSPIEDQDECPGNPNARMNLAARRLRGCVYNQV